MTGWRDEAELPSLFILSFHVSKAKTMQRPKHELLKVPLALETPSVNVT